MCFPLGPLPSPGAVCLLLLGQCCGAKSWKRNLFKVFRTHVNGQNLLTAELKYLFLLRNKALLLNLSTAGFVPQTGEKSLWGRNRRAGKMALMCVVCLHRLRICTRTAWQLLSPRIHLPCIGRCAHGTQIWACTWYKKSGCSCMHRHSVCIHGPLKCSSGRMSTFNCVK